MDYAHTLQHSKLHRDCELQQVRPETQKLQIRQVTKVLNNGGIQEYGLILQIRLRELGVCI